MEENIRVIVIEDDQDVLKYLCQSIDGDEGLRLEGSASSYSCAQALIESGDYDIALLDLNLQGETALDLIKVASASPNRRVIVVSVLGDETTVVDAIEAGAGGYILKDAGIDGLGDAIRSVRNGHAPISPAIARHLLRRFRESQPSAKAEECVDFLTRRETQVLKALARGQSYKEVAQTYSISLHTVGDYVKSLYRKLQVHSRGAAVSKALQNGIIKLD